MQIESVDFYDYRAPISEDVDKEGGEFRIKVHNEDIITQPGNSVLVIAGKVEFQKITKKSGEADKAETVVITEDNIKIVSHGMLHLFDKIEYLVGDTIVDQVRKPGIAGLMKGLVSLQNDTMYTVAGWIVRNPSIQLMSSDGFF